MRPCSRQCLAARMASSWLAAQGRQRLTCCSLGRQESEDDDDYGEEDHEANAGRGEGSHNLMVPHDHGDRESSENGDTCAEVHWFSACTSAGNLK